MHPYTISTPWPVYAGDAESLVIELKDDNGAAIDITEHYSDLRCQWRRRASDYQWYEIAIDESQSETGTIRLELTPEQTRGMGGPGVFDIQASVEGDPRTLLTGKTLWKGDVTR